MRSKGMLAAMVALLLAGLVPVLARHPALAWPALGSQTLMMLMLLAGVTRAAGTLGVRGQSLSRFLVAGLASAGAMWFGLAALGMRRVDLGMFAALHAAAAALAFGWPPGKIVREQAWLLAAAAAQALSIFALLALPAPADLPRAWPIVLGVLAALAVPLLARGLMIGLVATIAAGMAGAVAAEHAVSAAHAVGEPAERQAAAALVLLFSLVMATVPAILALQPRLDGVWRTLAPDTGPDVRRALANLTVPLVAILTAIAAILVA
jgi:hypothetical protein